MTHRFLSSSSKDRGGGGSASCCLLLLLTRFDPPRSQPQQKSRAVGIILLWACSREYIRQYWGGARSSPPHLMKSRTHPQENSEAAAAHDAGLDTFFPPYFWFWFLGGPGWHGRRIGWVQFGARNRNAVVSDQSIRETMASNQAIEFCARDIAQSRLSAGRLSYLASPHAHTSNASIQFS
jgi:hypothetical protein